MMKIEPVPLVLVIMPLYWLSLCNHIFLVSGLCLDDQKSLLIQLKNNLSTYTSELSRNKLKSWDPSDDCCAWMGVTCDKEGHVTGLDLSGESISGGLDHSSSLFSLQQLVNLNLAYNHFNSTIPSGFNKLKNLTYLNMSHAGFSGEVPTDISQLTRLVALDLTPGYLFHDLTIQSLQKLVQNLTSIRQLYLDGMQLDDQGQEWYNALLPLRDLRELSMAECYLQGPLDASLAQLKNLSVIILDGNNFSSPVPETFANFKNLTTLSLRECNLNGRFPPKIFQIETLSFIDISDNGDLHGFFPDFPLGGSLQTIKVSNTNFSGTLPTSVGNLRHLSVFDLSRCQFNGTLPSSLSKLTELTDLQLLFNKFTGPIPSFGMAKNLTQINLSNNELSGAIPSSHFEALINLIRIDLSHNYITGSIPSSLFTLPFLQVIDLNDNQFSQVGEFTNVSSSVLSLHDLRNNNVSRPFSDFNLTTFPYFLIILDLSNNQIDGIVPNWLWELPNLVSLNLSINLLTYLEAPIQKQNNVSSLEYLDLHDNQLQGPILIFPVNALYLDYSRNRFNSVIPQDIGNHLSTAYFLSLSDNKFHGNIPESLCTVNLIGLDLSINNISGTIPSCLISNGFRMILNLRENNLIGSIPDVFPATSFIVNLNLHGNHLHGPIPKSLTHCHNLEVLDLGKNQISGGFPCFLKNMSLLRVLVLRNNKFQGSLECGQADNKPWQKLQIVDISFNNFSGKLKGNYFTNWRTMMHDEEQSESEFIHKIYFMDTGFYYQDGVTIINKGLEIELVRIIKVFTFIDFSSNHFEGPMPEELMYFKALYALNLSNNALSGEIPSSIGNLKQLESLDLSHNSFHGEIPVQLAKLTFLSYLNLSFNHLVGKIPTGTQLQSFQASSFKGNEGLHGLPLAEKPEGRKQRLLQEPQCKRLACTVDWNFLSAELGFSCGIGIVILPLLFWKQWRIWYWKLMDQILCWIFPQLYLHYVTQGGQKYTVLRWWRQ